METVRLEGFGNTLRGQKIWLIGSENLLPNRLHVLEQELLGRGRKVLILADGRKYIPRWAHKFEWDAIFHLKDGTDLRLAITYVTNVAKPIRVVWCGEEPSAAVLRLLCANEVTFLGYGTHLPKSDWNAIFFSGDMDATKIEEALISRMVVSELRAAKAGLVWTSIGEPDKAGAVYWYDISEGEPPVESFDPVETATFLRDLADRIAAAK